MRRIAFEQAAGSAEPDFSRHQFGGALGGPVVRDRVHFFTAAERTKNNLYKSVIVQLPQYYGHFNGTFPSPEYNNMVFTRGDVLVTQSQNVFARYAWQDSDFTCEGCATSSPQPFFGAGGIQQKRYSLAGAHTWVLSSRVLNEMRGQWTNYHFRQHPAGVRPVEDLFDNSIERTAPLTPVYTFPSLSWGSSANFYTTQLSRQFRDDMTISTGSHTWKFGAGAQSLSIHGDNRPSLGTWTFSADQPFDPDQLSSFVPLPGSVSQFASGALLPLPVYNPNVMWDGYVEDEWRVRSNLTLQLGLRYEYQARVFNQGVDINDKNIFPTTGTPTQIPFVDFSKRGDNEQLRSAGRRGLGREGQRSLGGARGVRHLLQPDEHPDQGRRARELPPADRHARQPVVPGSVWRPRSSELRVHGAAEHRHQCQRPREPRVASLHPRSLAGAHVHAGHPRGRRVQPHDQGADGDRHQPAQRRHDGCAPAAAVWPHPGDAGPLAGPTTRRCWRGSRSGSTTATCT